jgi:hypothetical protein
MIDIVLFIYYRVYLPSCALVASFLRQVERIGQPFHFIKRSS